MRTKISKYTPIPLEEIRTWIDLEDMPGIYNKYRELRKSNPLMAGQWLKITTQRIEAVKAERAYK